MSTRDAVAVVTLASAVAASAAAGESGPLHSETSLGPRVPAPAAAPLVAPPSTLRLVWIDPTGAAVGADAAARDEARSVLRKMGAEVSWRRGDAGEPASAGEVRVILLDRAAENGGRAVLGATPPHFDVAPFIWVHVPSVRAVIGLDPRGSASTTPFPATRTLATALGRVVAHELVHALAPAVPHGTGLMSASLTQRYLTAPSIPVDAEVSLAVRAALRGDPPAPRPGGGTLATATAPGEPVR